MALWSLTCIELKAGGTITAADGKAKCTMPADGEIVRVEGYIETLGSGAGTSSDFQLSVGAVDYLATVGAFEVDSGTNVLESQVLAPNPTFDKDDVLELDCDAVSTNPADAHIWVYVKTAPVDGY